MKKALIFIRNFIASCIALLVMLVVAIFMWLERKIFKTTHIESWMMTWVDDMFLFNDFRYIYTETMYNKSLLPPFYFVRKYRGYHVVTRFKDQAVFVRESYKKTWQIGELYSIHGNSYDYFIQLVNRGIISSKSPLDVLAGKMANYSMDAAHSIDVMVWSVSGNKASVGNPNFPNEAFDVPLSKLSPLVN